MHKCPQCGVWPQYQRNTRGRLPDWYLRQPRWVRGDEIYLHAWVAMQTERVRSIRSHEGKMVSETGPIPWHSVILFAEKMGFSRSAQFWFAQVMLALDAAYREHGRKEEDAQRQRAARRERRKALQAKAKKGAKKTRRL